MLWLLWGLVETRREQSAADGLTPRAAIYLDHGHKSIVHLPICFVPTRVEEEVGVFIGREIAETMHGDSSHAIDLSRIATAAGPPSVFTNLAGDGSIFNARIISSRNKTHRQVNNRLVPMAKVDSRSQREAVSSTLFPSGLSKSPQKPKHLFGSPATAAACDFEKGVQLSH